MINLPSCDADTRSCELLAQCMEQTFPKCPLSVRWSFVDGGLRISFNGPFDADTWSIVLSAFSVRTLSISSLSFSTCRQGGDDTGKGAWWG